MEPSLKILILLAFIVKWCNGEINCYQCTVNPTGDYQNDTRRLCARFDESERYEITCPNSTFCMKKIYELTLLGGEKVHVEERDCAPQKYSYYRLVKSRWVMENTIQSDAYTDGCQLEDNKGLKSPTTKFCFCSSELCNTADSNHVDAIAVIFVFNIVKLILSIH